jgi:hypothetical protein
MIIRASAQFCFMVSFLLAVTLCGCGGGSSAGSAEPNAQTLQLSGYVVDGPVQGALVKLVDRDTGHLAAICPNLTENLCINNSDLTRTRETGYFTFFVDKSADLSGLVVVAEEGIDTVTGFDLNGFPLRADLQLFGDTTRDLIVSPLTTLLTPPPGPSPVAALSETDLGTWLNLAGSFDLLGDPQQDAELQRASRLLIKLADLVGGDNPLLSIAADSQPLLDGGLPNPLLLDNLGLTAAQQLSVVTYFSAPDPRREELLQTILQVLAEVGQENQFPTPVDPQDPTMRANAGQLADALLAAAGRFPTTHSIPANGHLAETMIRYSLATYGSVGQNLQDPATFLVAKAPFAGFLESGLHGEVGLAQNPQVATLIDLIQPFSILVPLPADEIPGYDNDKRVAYYLQSDASYLYQAQQLVKQVENDEITDAIQVEVAASLARGGLYAEAEVLLDLQVFQSQYKGDGYRRLGDVATEQGDLLTALGYLQRADDYYRRVAETGGFGSFTAQDGHNFEELVKAFRAAQDVVSALDILTYLNDNFATAITSITAYGLVFTVADDLGRDFFDAGDLANAAVVADISAFLAAGTPSNGTSEQSRVISLVKAAELYALLGDHDRVWSLYQQVVALRSGNPTTETRSVAYMDEMAVALYQVGESDEAFALANSLPGGTSRLDQMRAIKRLATAIALAKGSGTVAPMQPTDLADYSALDVVTYLVGPDLFNLEIDSKIEALTYFNSATSYIAKALIDAGRFNEAELALQEAQTLIDTLDDFAQKPVLKASSKIDYGLVKVAGLYRLMGNLTAADDLMQDAEQVLDRISEDLEIYPKVIVAIAEEYLQQGRVDDAQRVLGLIGEVLVVKDYQNLLDVLAAAGDRDGMLSLLPDYEALTGELYLDGVTPPEDHDKQLKTEVFHFTIIAGHYGTLGEQEAARHALDEAYDSASGILVEQDRIDRQIDVITAYAAGGEISLATALADALPYPRRRNEAKFEIAKALAARDDFPDDPSISIDTDHDGLPDFWWPQLGPPLGISLDNDSDGDGIEDTLDRRPLYNDSAAL